VFFFFFFFCFRTTTSIAEPTMLSSHSKEPDGESRPATTQIPFGPEYREQFRVAVLSRHPVQVGVAACGYASVTFTKDLYRYNVYIGFGKNPMSKNPYIRFLIAKGKNLHNPKDAEGVLLVEDPFGSPIGKSGVRPLEHLQKRTVSDTAYAVAEKCYNICWGVRDTLKRLGYLDGKYLQPFRKTAEMFSNPLMGKILGSFIKDPNGGFDATMHDLEGVHLESQPSLPLRDFLLYQKRVFEQSKLWSSFNGTDRSVLSFCHLVTEFSLGKEKEPDPKGPDRTSLTDGEVRILAHALGLSNQLEWLANLRSPAKIAALARSAWVGISTRIGVEEQLPSFLRVASTDWDNPTGAYFRLPELERISDNLIRVCRDLGIG